MDQPSFILRVTRRCLREDLELLETEVALPLERLAERFPIVASFVERRSASPVGQEIVTQLTTRKTVFTLHSRDMRGATWHQERAGSTWLLAVAFHRAGQRDDAYPHFRRLDRSGRLFPTREDFEALAEDQKATFASALLSEVPVLRRLAVASPATLVPGTVADRVHVRLFFEPGEPGMLTVAISNVLRPGSVPLPQDWQIRLVAAFLPDTPFDRLSWIGEIGGESIRDDEEAFCDFSE